MGKPKQNRPQLPVEAEDTRKEFEASHTIKITVYRKYLAEDLADAIRKAEALNVYDLIQDINARSARIDSWWYARQKVEHVSGPDSDD